MELKERVSNYLECLYEKPKWYEYLFPLGPAYFHRQKDIFFGVRSRLIEKKRVDEAENLKRSYNKLSRAAIVTVGSLMLSSFSLVLSGYERFGAVVGLSGVLSWNYSEFLVGLKMSKLINNIVDKSA